MKIKLQNIKNKIKLVGADNHVCLLPKGNTRNNLGGFDYHNHSLANTSNSKHQISNE